MPDKSLYTATQTRQWLVDHPASLATLSEAEKRTVVPVDGKFPKGRLARKAINVHNARNPKGEYVDGATRETAKAAAKAAKAARKAATRKASRKGVVIGARGPIPAQFAVSRKG